MSAVGLAEAGPLNVSPEVMEGETFSVTAAGGEAPPPLIQLHYTLIPNNNGAALQLDYSRLKQ